MLKCKLKWAVSGQYPVTGFYEYSNEPLGSIKDKDFSK
jgi:hypothetical protein